MRHSMRWLAGLATVGFLSVMAHAAAVEGEWPSFRGPNRDGKSAEKGLLKEWPAGGPKLLWKVSDIGKGFSSVTVSGGLVYTTGDKDGKLVISALDMDGKLQWKSECGAAWTGSLPGSRSTPTIDGGNLYLFSGNGALGCFDAKTGKMKWGKEAREFGGGVPGWGYAESVLIQDDMAIFTPGGKNCIVALNKNTGQPIWTSRGFADGAQYGGCFAFTHENTPMIVAGTHGGLVAVDAKSGRMLWANDWCANNTANCPTPQYADGYVFWANGYGKGGICMKLSGTQAKVAWQTKDMVCHHGGYIIKDGYIYGNHDGGVTCLELKTGKKMWHEKGVGKGSLCWADGMLYLFSENGGQAALATCSPEGMQLKGKVKVEGAGPSWAHPAVVGGRLYLRYDNNLYCFDVKAEK